MEDKDVFLLETILDYCSRIQNTLERFGLDHDKFIADGQMQDLCAFYCLQIGEYTNQLSDKMRNVYPEMEWHRIRGLRNIIAHDYGSTNIELLWTILKENIPELRDFCAGLIG